MRNDEELRRSEERLVRDFKNGDNLAFTALYNRHKRSVFVFCSKMLMNSEKAKDVVQETFLRIFEHREQLTHPSRFRSWVFAIARNQCLTAFRHSKHEAAEEVEFDLVNASSDESPEESLERHQNSDLVNKYLSRSRIEYREVLILREYQNLSYREIAETLGSTESAIKSRIFKARQRLFELLKPILKERG